MELDSIPENDPLNAPKRNAMETGEDDQDPAKKNKSIDSNLNGDRSIAVARSTSLGKIKRLVEGDVNIISLCVSTCGTRGWARKRDTRKLVVCDFHDYPEIKWKDCECGTDVGAFGMTRCGATGDFLVLQAHSTGCISMTNGFDVCHRGHLVNSLHPISLNLRVVSPETIPPKDEQCALKAVSPVHNIGLVAVVEKIGLVFMAFLDCFVPANTAHILLKSASNREAETQTDMEATLSVHGHLVAVAEKQNIIIVNMATAETHATIPILGLQPDERVWQLEMSSRALCVCTPESIAWFDTRRRQWNNSTCNAAIACHACDTQDTIAMVTAVGDVVAIDSLGRTAPKRLEQGTSIEPYASTHTRDGIAAWGGKYAHTLKLLKTGGEIHEVTFY